MSESFPEVTVWNESEPPALDVLLKKMTNEDLAPYRWSNSPNEVYQSHRHGFHKVIYVVSGEIIFGLPEAGEKLHLKAGDRLDLPAGVLHDAVVGPYGVVCLEGHRFAT